MFTVVLIKIYNKIHILLKMVKQVGGGGGNIIENQFHVFY